MWFYETSAIRTNKNRGKLASKGIFFLEERMVPCHDSEIKREFPVDGFNVRYLLLNTMNALRYAVKYVPKPTA